MAILIVLLFLVTAAILNSHDQTKFYYSEVLESDHAAYEIKIHGCSGLRELVI